jgi:hypothetical protein
LTFLSPVPPLPALLILLTRNQDVAMLVTHASFSNAMHDDTIAANFPAVLLVVMTVYYCFDPKRSSESVEFLKSVAMTRGRFMSD